MKTYIILYSSHDKVHEFWKIQENHHDKAMEEAYKIYNKDWESVNKTNKLLKMDFYENAEVIAIIDSPIENVNLTYKSISYKIPE